MFASFHSKGTIPSFNNKLNTLASSILTCSTVSNSSFAHLYKMNVFIIIIIIIINLYGVYILRNLNSEAQQNRIIKHNHEQGTRKSHYQNEGQPKSYGGNAIWNKYVLRFFSENSYSFRCLLS